MGVEARDDAFEARDRGVRREHKRVVAGDDVIRRGGEFLNRLEAFDHLRNVDDDGIGSHRFHVFVVVRGVATTLPGSLAETPERISQHASLTSGALYKELLEKTTATIQPPSGTVNSS